MTDTHRLSLSQKTRSLLRLACAGLLTLPVLLAVPTHAQAPDPTASSQNSDLPPAGSVRSEKPDAARADPAEASMTPEASADDAGEMRGLWVVRDSLISPQSVHRVVLTAVKYHLNALFVQVRGRGDAWYNSPYEPRAELLAGQPRDFDPLRQIVEEAHANGLQVHAWLNTFLTWSGSRRPRNPQHIFNAHPDWFARDRHGHCSPIPNDDCEGIFLQPSNPAVQEHLFKVFTDVASRYDIDGIHFDYCRYAGIAYDFSPSTLARFRHFMAAQLSAEEVARLDKRLTKDRLAYVHAFGKPWADWRRAQITQLVARISAAVKADKPWMQVSAAVSPDADDAFIYRGQDWRGWLQAGYLDAVALMAYGKSTERILEQTRRAVAAAGGRQVYTGIGAWHLSAHDVAKKIAQVRRAGAAGVNLFSYGGIHTRPEYLETLRRGVFASRAAPRRMRWLPSRGGVVRRGAPEATPPANASGSTSDRADTAGRQQ